MALQMYGRCSESLRTASTPGTLSIIITKDSLSLLDCVSTAFTCEQLGKVLSCGQTP